MEVSTAGVEFPRRNGKSRSVAQLEQALELAQISHAQLHALYRDRTKSGGCDCFESETWASSFSCDAVQHRQQ